MRWLDSIPGSMDMDLSKLEAVVKDRKAWHAAVLSANIIKMSLLFSPKLLIKMLPTEPVTNII